jgi:hypothetical protein
LKQGDEQVLLEEPSVLDAVAAAERATQQVVDVTQHAVVESPLIGESAAPAVAAPVGNATAGNTTAVPKDKKSKTLFAAKVNAYVSKIKKVEALKKQHWLPKNEQQLAGKLVQLDDLEKETPAERKIENELRVGVKGTDVELSLRRLHEHRRQKKKEQIAKEKQEKHEKRLKAEKDLAYAREQKAINAQLKKYRKLSVSKKLKKQLTAAKSALDSATLTEKKHKGSSAVKKFAKEYGLNRPAEKEHDYPKGPASQQTTKKAEPTKAAEPKKAASVAATPK